MIMALRTATEALENGELVCIFPEGQMSRIGQLLPFRRGMERIMRGRNHEPIQAPIIPVDLSGVWGSIFSFEGGRFLWKLPQRIPYPVAVTYGKPLPPTTTAPEVRQIVQEMSTDGWAFRKRYMRPLHRAFLRTARRHPRRLAMADVLTGEISFFGALVKTIFLARRLRGTWRDQQTVGIMLPPTVSGALVNLAALMMGKIPVNLNYTASGEVLKSCAEQCGLKTVITSQAFLDRVRVQPPGEIVLLEKIAEAPRAGEKIAAALAALLLPMRGLERFTGADRRVTMDDVATIIFSSGSTGNPKGVPLTHYNLASNGEQANQVFMLSKHDRMLGVLPFFQAFGFSVTL